MKIPALRKIFILFFFVVVSCSKDDPTPTEMLVGKWNTGTVTFNILIGDMTLSQYFVSTGVSSMEALLYTTLINSTLQSYLTGEMQVNADKTFTWKTTASSTMVNGTWSIDNEGKELTLNSTAIGLGGVFEITELTGSKLSTHSLQNMNTSMIGSTLPSSVTVDITLVFIKD